MALSPVSSSYGPDTASDDEGVDSTVPLERVSHVAPRAGRYERRERLGVGAMGEVHLCYDPILRREVAMKTAIAGADDLRAASRLAREARIQGRLEHPAIVPVHDLGLTGGACGSPFFTMKRVQGTSLRAVLTHLRAKDPATLDRYGRRRLLSAFSTVCVAVAFAHARGVLHRDIKPSNVMLGDFGEVYLLDWGVAKASEDDVASLPRTRVGDMIGTLGYMAPEQARGDADVDERVDVYALGALLFELLTFEPLHQRTAAAALRSTLVGDYDARPSVRAPGAKIPPELEALCVRATMWDRDERIGSARELHEAIERFLDGDRDGERRRHLSAEHARRARALATRALRTASDTDDPRHDRQRAIDEANRALALDPTNDAALHVVAAVALLTEPGAEAAEALRESTSTTRRLLARTGVAMFIPWIAGLALATLLGVRDGGPLALAFVATAVAGGLAWWRSRTDSMAVTFATLVACDLAAALGSCVFGPFIMVPGLLGACALAFTIATEPRGTGAREPRVFRAIALGVSLLALVAPLALELAGVVSPSIAFEHGAIVLLPRAVEFPPEVTLALLVLGNAILVAVPSLIAMRVRDHALDVERRAIEALSRTRQLLPAPVRQRA